MGLTASQYVRNHAEIKSFKKKGRGWGGVGKLLRWHRPCETTLDHSPPLPSPIEGKPRMHLACSGPAKPFWRVGGRGGERGPGQSLQTQFLTLLRDLGHTTPCSAPQCPPLVNREVKCQISAVFQLAYNHDISRTLSGECRMSPKGLIYLASVFTLL